MLSHRNLLANLEQTGVWISGSFEEGREIVIAPLPMYHIFCLTSTLSFMTWGSLSVLISNPRDLPALVAELGRWKWSVLSGVNTLFNGLLHTPGFDALDFSSLKVVIGGGAAVQRAGRRALEAGHRTLHHRSLRPHRSLAGGQRLAAGYAMERHDRPAVSVHRGDPAQRRLRGPAAVDRR
jgi:acyl-CoA synthetase (AMP-forming)/AMP-acid ligase II